MTIKLIVLKSGEELISDVAEMSVPGESDDDQRVVGYFLNRPCVVKMKNPGVLNQDKKTTRSGFEVSLLPWMPLSADERIPVPADWLVTMVTPVQKLEEMYVEDVLNYGKPEDDSSSTASDQPAIGVTD